MQREFTIMKENMKNTSSLNTQNEQTMDTQNSHNSKNSTDKNAKENSNFKPIDLNATESQENTEEERSITEEEIKSLEEAQILLKEQNSTISEMKQSLEDMQKQLAMKVADFANFKRAQQKQQDEFRIYANEKILRSFLPLYDSFELALSAYDVEKFDSEQAEGLYKSIEQIKKQLESIFSSNTLKPIAANEGDIFEPQLHVATTMEKEQADTPEDRITKIFQKGFMLGDRVLRHTMVSVKKGNPELSKNQNDSKKQTETDNMEKKD